MVIEYVIVALSFGIASYFEIYKRARRRAIFKLGRKHTEDKGHHIVSFIVWTIMASVLAPLVLLVSLGAHETLLDSIANQMYKDLLEEKL